VWSRPAGDAQQAMRATVVHIAKRFRNSAARPDRNATKALSCSAARLSVSRLSDNQSKLSCDGHHDSRPRKRKTEGDGKEMFQAVCTPGLGGIVSTGCTPSLRSVESVDKSQKREGTCRNSRYRWHLLTLGFPASNLVLERTKG